MANARRGATSCCQGFETAKPIPGIVRDVRGIGLMIGVEFDTHEHAEAVDRPAFSAAC